MSDLCISIERVSPELLQAYTKSGMERGAAGADAINWTFAGNYPAFAVAREHGRITGISAYIRSEMKLGEGKGTGYQAVDSFVSSDMRGRGLFTKLARAYAKHADQSSADVIWGFPNDNAAPAWFSKLGWEIINAHLMKELPAKSKYPFGDFKGEGDKGAQV